MKGDLSMKEEKMYVVFGNKWKDGYGIDLKCFGIFTNKHTAEHIKDSLIGTEYVNDDDAFVIELPVDQETEFPIVTYIE